MPASFPTDLSIVKLASGTITSPIAYLDLALPAGYTSFRLLLGDFFVSATDDIAMAFSVDGGATFLNDTTNFDTYCQSYLETPGNSVAAGGTALTEKFDDSLLDVTPNMDVPGIGLGINLDAIIVPGSGSSYAYCSAAASSFGINGGGAPAGMTFTDGFYSINPLATVTPTKQRVNYMRVQPYGNGHANPPSSGETCTAGSYILWGITS